MKSSKNLVIGGVLVAAAVTIILVAGVLFRGNAAAPAAEPQSSVTIYARDMLFDLSTITAKVGQPITIHFVNEDTMDHSFAIDAFNIYTDTVKPNQSASVTFTPQEAGTYTFRCPLFRHDKLGMVGTFQVIS